MREPEVLALVEGPTFTSGIVFERGRVVSSAPIVRYMNHWTRERVEQYCASRGWKLQVIDRINPCPSSEPTPAPSATTS
jgi:hypothetical protein